MDQIFLITVRKRELRAMTLKNGKESILQTNMCTAVLLT